MLISKQNNLSFKHQFDPKKKRHFLNNINYALHCHHYATLYTQLAMDSSETEVLADSAEESFYQLISEYLNENSIDDLLSRVDVACQFYNLIGLGSMEIEFISTSSAKVLVPNSHIDLGWIKKWGKYDKPVNYITCGFIAAMLSAIMNKPIATYKVFEVESFVMGAPQSVFKAIKK